MYLTIVLYPVNLYNYYVSIKTTTKKDLNIGRLDLRINIICQMYIFGILKCFYISNIFVNRHIWVIYCG